jgi:hypothetical protein
MKKPYIFTVQYDIAMLKGDPLEDYLYADSYLIKLMKDRDGVVFIGNEMGLAADEGVIERQIFFKADSLEAALDALQEFSDNEEDFNKSYMEEGASLDMTYEESEYPISEEEIEYSLEKMEEDPRKFFEIVSDAKKRKGALLEHGIVVEDDDDYWGDDDNDDDEPN